MKRLVIVLAVIVCLAGALVFVRLSYYKTDPDSTIKVTGELSAITVVAENLEIPWDIAFLPEGDLLVTERPGRLVKVNSQGEKSTVLFEHPEQSGEGGLLGIVLHPDFAVNRWLYLYMTQAGVNGQTINRVVRYFYGDNALTQDKIIIDNIPGAIHHDGGRLEFGPPTSCKSGQADCLLYITTGDATVEQNAQDKNSLAGKILRLHDDGRIPPDNPFGTAIYSYGHRNPQGLAWDSAGQLWETEHGRSGVVSGLDEVNRIDPGANYGWPQSEGDRVQAGTTDPVRHSGSKTTWAPASAAIINNRLFFGGLLGEALYEAELNGETITMLKSHFKGELGRIRTVRVGPDGMLYMTTSNRDGRGNPKPNDDKIIRVNLSQLKK